MDVTPEERIGCCKGKSRASALGSSVLRQQGVGLCELLTPNNWRSAALCP